MCSHNVKVLIACTSAIKHVIKTNLSPRHLCCIYLRSIINAASKLQDRLYEAEKGTQ